MPPWLLAATASLEPRSHGSTLQMRPGRILLETDEQQKGDMRCAPLLAKLRKSPPDTT